VFCVRHEANATSYRMRQVVAARDLRDKRTSERPKPRQDQWEDLGEVSLRRGEGDRAAVRNAAEWRLHSFLSSTPYFDIRDKRISERFCQGLECAAHSNTTQHNTTTQQNQNYLNFKNGRALSSLLSLTLFACSIITTALILERERCIRFRCMGGGERWWRRAFASTAT
jgi:hypothetical protein